MYGELYICNHPVYSRCTLFKIRDKGLAVIQQRFDTKTKNTCWTEVDAWLVDQLYLNPKFKDYFDKRAGTCKDGLYPTVSIRQMMWGLKMKPLKRNAGKHILIDLAFKYAKNTQLFMKEY